MTGPGWESRFRGAVAGLIEAGVEVRASTSQLWAEIRGAAAEAGLAIGRQGWQLVNEMRGQAAARRRGYETFQRADLGQAFGPAMAAPSPNVRSAAQRAILPAFLVRFDLTYTGPDGEEATQVVSLKHPLEPGMTVGDVYDRVAEAAEGLALDYGQGLVGYGNLRPVTI